MKTSPATAISTFLGTLSPGRRLVLAYSGGLDSEVLLHLLHASLPLFPGLSLAAIHVHHGLSLQADAWAEHCRARCAALAVAFDCRRVRVAPATGESLEAVARTARYAALTQDLGPADVLVTAHHRDDQAETVLLRLLRGSGTTGLAAMMPWMARGESQLARPLLGVSRSDLLAWAEARRLSWVEDESNSATTFDRNYLRRVIMPTLVSRWPAAPSSLARSAELLAESADLLGCLAELDLASARTAYADGLCITPLLNLSPARQRNALRHWLAELAWPMPSRVVLERLRLEVLLARADAKPFVTLAGGEVRRYRGQIFADSPLPVFDAHGAQDLQFGEPLRLMSGLGVLQVETVVQGGLRLPHPDEPVSVRYRVGGERFQPVGRAHGQALKKLWQEAGVLPWLRDRLPLVYYGENLVAVAGIGVAVQAQATPGQSGVHLRLVTANGLPLRLCEADWLNGLPGSVADAG